MLNELQIGIKNADGSIAREAELCAVSGRRALGEHGMLLMLDATHFVRVLSVHSNQVNDAWIDAARASLQTGTDTPDAAEGVNDNAG